jgi:hypothetical protein
MKTIKLLIILTTIYSTPIMAQVGLDIPTGIVVKTDGASVEISAALNETGTGYFSGKISSGSRTGMTTFAGFTLSSAMNGTIVRNTGSAYAKGNGEGTNFLRYYEVSNSSSAVTADLQAAYVGSGTYDERNSLASPYFLYKYATVWSGFGDGSSSSPISAASILVNAGSTDWVLSDGGFVTFNETNLAATGSTISFNDGQDGRQIDMNFSSLGGSGNVTVTQNNHAPTNAPCCNVCGFQWDITADGGITSFNVDLTFYYHDTDIIGITESAAFLGIAKFNSSTNTWQWLGGTVNSANNTVTVSDVTSFSTFALFCRIFGDITGNGYVDAADLQRLGDCWHQTNSGEFTPGCDGRFFNFNKTTDGGNHTIDAADLQVFGDCWHNGVEPGLMLLNSRSPSNKNVRPKLK